MFLAFNHIKYGHIILIFFSNCFNNHKIFVFLIETMIPVKKLAFAKIKKKYINKKIYLE
jgi:hypothetical protein